MQELDKSTLAKNNRLMVLKDNNLSYLKDNNLKDNKKTQLNTHGDVSALDLFVVLKYRLHF